MKPCLVDVNVVIGLLAPRHPQHDVCRRWYSELEVDQARFCRLAQLGAVRLLSNPVVMGGNSLSPMQAWQAVGALLEDPRIRFMDEPAVIDTPLEKLLTDSRMTSKLVSDAYLAAFAIAGKLALVTLDKSFRNFDGLDLLVLA